MLIPVYTMKRKHLSYNIYFKVFAALFLNVFPIELEIPVLREYTQIYWLRVT